MILDDGFHPWLFTFKSALKIDKQEEQDTQGCIAEKGEENLTPNYHEFIEIFGKNVNKY